MPKAFVKSYLVYDKLEETPIRAIAGALLNNLYIDQEIPSDKYAEIVYEKDIPLNVFPTKPVIKMAKKDHIEAFFRDGTLQLGTFDYYNSFDHEEIGDSAEGSFLLVGCSPSHTAFAEMGGGYNNYVFCCYAGEPDEMGIKRFGYESYFEIVDILGFAKAIQSQIDATKRWYGACAYSTDKVLLGDTPPNFDFNVLSDIQLDLVNMSKYFIKPSTYSHQSEFRFIWQMHSDVEKPLIITCPKAVKFCRKSSILI